MNEHTRMAYLDALGIDHYVSRGQLPGAAKTQRLVGMARPQVAMPVPGAAKPAPARIPQPQAAGGRAGPRMHPRPERDAPASLRGARAATAVPHFSLATIVAGDWLWVEELAGMPLTTEQVQLVQSMAQALLVRRAQCGARSDTAGPVAVRPDPGRPDVMQFDWPIHANRQLDQGEEAARSGVAGFLVRRLEQHGCRGIVLLGDAGAARVPVPQLGVVFVQTASCAQMLANPVLKRQAWRDLLPLAGQP